MSYFFFVTMVAIILTEFMRTTLPMLATLKSNNSVREPYKQKCSSCRHFHDRNFPFLARILEQKREKKPRT